MTLNLKCKTVLIVGGSSGMGYGVAEQSLREGAKVIVASRSAEKLQSAVAELGPGATYREFDSTNEKSIQFQSTSHCV